MVEWCANQKARNWRERYQNCSARRIRRGADRRSGACGNGRAVCLGAARAERDELQAKLDRIREAVEGMTGLPSVSKLAAFLETIREIIKPKEG